MIDIIVHHGMVETGLYIYIYIYIAPCTVWYDEVLSLLYYMDGLAQNHIFLT